MKIGRDASARSIEEVCRGIWQIEKDYDLLAWKAHDVFVWPLIRMRLYTDFTQRLGLFDVPHPILKKIRPATYQKTPMISPLDPYWDKMLRRLEGRWAPFCSLLRHRHYSNETPYVILHGDRRIEGKEPYTKALCDELGERALLLERLVQHSVSDGRIDYNELRRVFARRYGNTKFGPLSELRRVFARRYGNTKFGLLPHASLKLCNELVIAFRKRLGVNVNDLSTFVERIVRGFRAQVIGFEKFFTIHRTETLFLINAYNRLSTVEAARRAGAHVVELQHGFISQYHLGYSWPGRPDVPYSPDELWCFGNFWHEATPLAAGIYPRVIGAPYVEELSRLANAPRDDNLVIFASQGVIGPKLFDLALATASACPDRRIIFRLHPSELLETYREFEPDGGFPPNFSLSHQTPNIFALMARGSIQIGVFSTTLLEGMALGTRTIVVDLPGVEYMEPIIARGDALLVKTLDELIEKLDQAPLCRDPKYYYDTPVQRLL